MDLLLVIFILSINRSACLIIMEQKAWESINLRVFIQPKVILKLGTHQNVREKKNPQKESPEIKKEICQNLFTSSYCKIEKREDWVDTDKEKIRDEIRNTFYFQFLVVFKNENFLKSDGYTYKNPSIHYEEREDSPKDVYAFSCFVRKRDDGKLKQYHVSEAFDVNFPEFDLNNIGGRFIFSKNDKTLRLEVFAADFSRVQKELNVKDSNDLEDLRKELNRIQQP